MSFLTPLYIAGALAIALPIIFHLIRRTPQQRQVFSSLMFLNPSPPRLTRKSRLNNILLLILRSAALILLALAFARPFLRSAIADAHTAAPTQKIAILLDTSASMRRGDLWKHATEEVESVLSTITEKDEVALFSFDRDVKAAFTADQWNKTEATQRPAALRAALANVQPTWFSTQLGSALSNVAEQLAASDDKEMAQDAIHRKIVLISDLQQGSHAEALQGHQWPDAVVLEIKPVAIEKNTNAGLQFIQSQADNPADDRLRVRVSNSSESDREQFELTWATSKGAVPTTQPQKIYVPPGRGKIVRVDWPVDQPAADHVVLQGDQADFDNALYLVRPRQETQRIVYLGNDAPDDIKGLQFYLRTAFGDTPQRRIEFIQKVDQLSPTDLTGTNLLVIGNKISGNQSASIHDFITTGGQVFWVITDTTPITAIEKVTNIPSLTISEASLKNFALISRVDLQNPLFAAFNDTRFSDFSQIHFWKHRSVKYADTTARPIAWFDDGDPFLIEKSIGNGRIILATSGWQPGDSQFALSTKFVPILSGMIHSLDQSMAATQITVGDLLPTPDGKWKIKSPSGRAIDLSSENRSSIRADEPGIYTLGDGQQQYQIAANLAADESRTAPLSPGDFKQWGAKFESAVPTQAAIEQQRQLKFYELENRQKLWQWLLVGVLLLIGGETVLAGKLSRNKLLQSSVATTNEVTG